MSRIYYKDLPVTVDKGVPASKVINGTMNLIEKSGGRITGVNFTYVDAPAVKKPEPTAKTRTRRVVTPVPPAATHLPEPPVLS